MFNIVQIENKATPAHQQPSFSEDCTSEQSDSTLIVAAQNGKYHQSFSTGF